MRQKASLRKATCKKTARREAKTTWIKAGGGSTFHAQVVDIVNEAGWKLMKVSQSRDLTAGWTTQDAAAQDRTALDITSCQRVQATPREPPDRQTVRLWHNPFGACLAATRNEQAPAWPSGGRGRMATHQPSGKQRHKGTHGKAPGETLGRVLGGRWAREAQLFRASGPRGSPGDW
jgi:hypothetical protein